jgi:hypothetical protein
MWQQQPYVGPPIFDVPSYEGFASNLPPGLPTNVPPHLRSRLGPTSGREAHLDHRSAPQKPYGSISNQRPSSSGRGEGAPITPPQSCDEGSLRPKMSRSQARRHRRNILHQVINHPAEAQHFIERERQRFVDNWYKEHDQAQRPPNARSPQVPMPRQSGPSGGNNTLGGRQELEELCYGSSSAPGSSAGSERGVREQLDQRVRAQTAGWERAGASNQPKASPRLSRPSSAKGSTDALVELEKLKVGSSPTSILPVHP